MIDENLTFIFYGYHSFDLRERSDKRIIAICDQCGKSRALHKKDYRSLCKQCVHLEKNLSKETKNKMSKSGKERFFTKKHKKNLSKSGKGRIVTEETRDKISKTLMGNTLSDLTKEKMSTKRKGKLNSNWRGGLSFGKYCYKFNNLKKKEIRDLYNNCDFISGLHMDICNNGINLDVHHINYNKNQGCNNNEWKLIPLSRSNHSKTNHNRWFWNKLFINVLKIDEWYYEYR